MTINNQDLSIFGANLLERIIVPASLDRPYRWPSGAKTPWISSDKRWGFKALTLSFEFKGSHTTIEANKSQMILALSECDIQFVANGLFYHCVLLNSDIGDQPAGFEVLEVELLCYTYGALVSRSVSTGQTVTLDSTADTPVILTLTATSTNPVSIKGFGEEIVISGLAVGQTIVINGETGSIKIGAANAYDKYDSWSFPFLKPGNNAIIVSPAVALTIVYKPRWL